MTMRHLRFYTPLLILCTLLFPKSVFCAPTLTRTDAATIPSGFAANIKRIRVAADGTVYALGTLATGFAAVSSDGNSVSTTNYSATIPTPSQIDFSITGNTIYVASTAGTNGRLLRFDISGTTASLVASTNQSGAGAVALSPDLSTVYSSRTSGIRGYDTTLSPSTSTSSVSASISRMAISNDGILYYISSSVSSNLMSSTTFSTTGETTLITGLGTGSSSNSLVISPDSAAAYLGYSTYIRKYALSGSPTLLWTKSYSNTLRGMDVDSSGNIYTAQSNGVLEVYSPIYAPSSFSIAPSTNSAGLSWTNSSIDSDFGGVMIRRSDTTYPTSIADATLVSSNVLTLSYTDTGLNSATQYYYTIFNKTIDGFYSAGVTSNVLIPPDAPTLAAHISTSNMSQIDLNWDVPTGTNTFTLQRDFNSGGYATVQAGLANSVTSYNDTGLVDGTYTYKIFALDAASNSSNAGTSAPLTIDTTPPDAPTLTAALTTLNGSQIDLNWNTPSDTNTFTLERSINSGGYATVQTGIASSTTTLSQTGLSDSTYTYKIFAIDAAGNISNAGISTTLTVDTTAPSAPNLTATLTTLNGSQIDLHWNTPSGTDTFTIQRSVNGGGYTTVQSGIASSTTTVSQMGLSDGTYAYKIFAVDAAGNISTAGTASPLTIDTTAPIAPTSVTAAVDGITILLTWVNPISDFDSITIRKSISTFPATVVDGDFVAANLTGTSFEDEDLALGTYYYSLFAIDARGNASVAANVTVVNAGVTPTMATGDAQEIDVSSAILVGTIDDIGTSDVIVRGFEYGETTSYGFTSEEDGDFTTGAFELTLQDLDCGTTYHYRVFATNETGTAYGADNTFVTSTCTSSGDSHIAVTVQAPTSPVQINGTTTFVVTLDNSDTSDSENRTITFTLSDNIAFVSAELIVTSDTSESVVNTSISQIAECSGTNPVSCDIGTVPANSSVTLLITVRALSTGPMSLVVDTGDEISSGNTATTGDNGGAVDTRSLGSRGITGCALIKESF